MSSKFISLDDRLYHYVLDQSLREPEVLRQLRQETAHHPRAAMQIAPEQGQFMGLLIQLMGARKALEIGVFTGYSSLSVALALPPDGRLVACDVDAEFTAMARRYWELAGVSDKIELKLAPALETLDALLKVGEAGTFDFAFIDADKENYGSYFEACLQLLRPGGLIAIDNVLWSGDVADPTVTDANTGAIRDLNQRLHQDKRVRISLLTIADGVTLALKL